MDEKYKVCSKCSSSWGELEQMLKDLNMHFDGYIANEFTPEKGLFLFTHLAEECKSTLCIYVKDCFSLEDSPIKVEQIQSFKMGEAEDCPGFCLDHHNLDDCHSQSCNGAVIGALIEYIKITYHK